MTTHNSYHRLISHTDTRRLIYSRIDGPHSVDDDQSVIAGAIDTVDTAADTAEANQALAVSVVDKSNARTDEIIDSSDIPPHIAQEYLHFKSALDASVIGEDGVGSIREEGFAGLRLAYKVGRRSPEGTESMGSLYDIDLSSMPGAEHFTEEMMADLTDKLTLKLGVLTDGVDDPSVILKAKELLTSQLFKAVDNMIKYNPTFSSWISSKFGKELTNREYKMLFRKVDTVTAQLQRAQKLHMTEDNMNGEQALLTAITRYGTGAEIKPDTGTPFIIDRINGEGLTTENALDTFEFLLTLGEGDKIRTAIESGREGALVDGVMDLMYLAGIQATLGELTGAILGKLGTAIGNRMPGLADKFGAMLPRLEAQLAGARGSRTGTPGRSRPRSDKPDVNESPMMAEKVAGRHDDRYSRPGREAARSIVGRGPGVSVNLINTIEPTNSRFLSAYIELNALELLEQVSLQTLTRHLKVAESLSKFVERHGNRINRSILRHIDEYYMEINTHAARLNQATMKKAVHIMRQNVINKLR